MFAISPASLSILKTKRVQTIIMNGESSTLEWFTYSDMLKPLTNASVVDIALTVFLPACIGVIISGLLRCYDWKTLRSHHRRLSEVETRREYYRQVFATQKDLVKEDLLIFSLIASAVAYLVLKGLIPYVKVIELFIPPLINSLLKLL